MNDDISVKTPSSFLPIAIALLGVVLGGTAIYLSISGSGQIKDDITQQIKEATVTVEQYEKRIAALEERIRLTTESGNTYNMRVSKLEENLGKLAQQTQAVVNQLGQEIASVKTAQATLASQQSTPRTSEATTSVSTTSSSTEQPAQSTSAPASGEDVYVVKSGDTFTKIAQTLGVKLSDIEKANPGVDSTRLRVGQKLNVPAKQ